ncbi:hypothetical protein [Moorena sp. SIO3I6]|uniref:hypothetical protein n=1 Tax=Moorena sp. SIO3I6 TaxID=2607831 RepID=UPI0013F7772A|nr:hypothetical protein [Moorena sp. SIO3I6]NEP24485.1 hypothetical protein [Moorena sp. SIO3I6]
MTSVDNCLKPCYIILPEKQGRVNKLPGHTKGNKVLPQLDFVDYASSSKRTS